MSFEKNPKGLKQFHFFHFLSSHHLMLPKFLEKTETQTRTESEMIYFSFQPWVTSHVTNALQKTEPNSIVRIRCLPRRCPSPRTVWSRKKTTLGISLQTIASKWLELQVSCSCWSAQMFSIIICFGDFIVNWITYFVWMKHMLKCFDKGQCKKELISSILSSPIF